MVGHAFSLLQAGNWAHRPSEITSSFLNLQVFELAEVELLLCLESAFRVVFRRHLASPYKFIDFRDVQFRELESQADLNCFQSFTSRVEPAQRIPVCSALK